MEQHPDLAIAAALAEPGLALPPPPPGPPAAGPVDWLRRNLFRSVRDGIVTVIAGVIVGYIVFRLGRFVFVTARWTIIQRNLTLFMVGRYPRDELWRIVVSLIAMSGYAGLLAGHVHRRQVLAGRAPSRRSATALARDLASRLWPLALGVVVLLALTRTVTPTLVAIAVIAAAALGRVAGDFLGKRWLLPLVVVGIVAPILLVALVVDAMGWDRWGGMMLNLLLAVAGISLSFPLGVLLALGRRAGRRTDSVTGGIVVAVLLGVPALILTISQGFAPGEAVSWLLAAATVGLAVVGFRLGQRSSLPLVRVASVAYIEFFRGVPLYVLLGLGYLGIGFFLPANRWPDWLRAIGIGRILPTGNDPPGLVVRATVVFVLFTAAYIAEIVRGGLQSLPRGQTEAGQALGLSPVRINLLIVLPQALRNVIPAIVGQFISLFKDTTLAGAAIGFLDVLNVAGAASGQDEFRGQGLTAETLTFVMFLFWVGCITMSRESQRLERKLGVGTR